MYSEGFNAALRTQNSFERLEGISILDDTMTISSNWARTIAANWVLPIAIARLLEVEMRIAMGPWPAHFSPTIESYPI